MIDYGICEFCVDLNGKGGGLKICCFVNLECYFEFVF